MSTETEPAHVRLTLRDYQDRLPARIHARLEVRDGPLPSPCIVWTGHTVNGYASSRWEGRERKLHVVIHRLIVGPTPAGLVLDHLCRVRPCVYIAHLEVVTQRVNIRRGVGLAALEAQRVTCPAGHPYDGTNTVEYRGRRYCRACHSEHSRSYRARKAAGA